MNGADLGGGDEEFVGAGRFRGIPLLHHESHRAHRPRRVDRAGGGDGAALGQVLRAEDVGEQQRVDETARRPADGPAPEADLERERERGVTGGQDDGELTTA